MQRELSQNQIAAFYHDCFVQTQAEDFIYLLGSSFKSVIDVGGGRGYFAKSIRDTLNVNVTVLDSDKESVEFCRQAGVDAIEGDALNPEVNEAYDVVSFNLILHHLVGKSDDETLALQSHALSAWRLQTKAIFINEYIYESFWMNNLSGLLIFKITGSPLLSKLGHWVSRFMPSLRANTFGVGVRFRSHTEWVEIFRSLGFDVVSVVKGQDEFVSLPRRLLLIKNCRRDSFLLKPISV